jgi:hypothetical protein
MGKRSRLCFAVMAVPLGATLLVPGKALASPMSATGCSPPFTWEITNYQACISDSSDSNGYYVGTMSAWRRTAHSGWFHAEVRSPSGQTLANGPTSYYSPPPGDDVLVQDAVWRPYRNVAGGQYCGILWESPNQSGGPYYDVAKACIGVS